MSLIDLFIEHINPVDYITSRLGITKIYPNQIKIIEAVTNPAYKKVAILSARQSGKSFAIIVSAIYLADTIPNISILIFAPSMTQARTIIGKRLNTLVMLNRDRLFNPPEDPKVHIKSSGITFSNNSQIKYISADPKSNIVGDTGHYIILDESQDILDWIVSEKILPMGGGVGGKIIQIGTPMYKNHFYECFKDPTYYSLKFDWLNCPKLYENGTITIKNKKYPSFAFERMPLALKLKYFEEEFKDCNPEELAYLQLPGDMSVESFKTQYLLEWVEDAEMYIKEEERPFFFYKNKIFETLDRGKPNEFYYAGIDFAGGEKEDSDATAVSIIRNNRGVKEKVYFLELNNMNLAYQTEFLINFFYSKFKNIISIYADKTGCGMGPISELIKAGLPVTGIMFGESDKILKTKLNYKNAMLETFKAELLSHRFKYPLKDNVSIDQKILYEKSLMQWFNLIQKGSTGLNKKIEADKNLNDDHPMADILANFAAVIDQQSGVYYSIKSSITNGVPAITPVLHKMNY